MERRREGEEKEREKNRNRVLERDSQRVCLRVRACVVCGFVLRERRKADVAARVVVVVPVRTGEIS